MRVLWLLLSLMLVTMAWGCRGSQTATSPQPAPDATTSEAGGGSGVAWLSDYEEARRQAKEEAKPLMVDVMSAYCHFCKKLDEEVWARSDVGELSRQFVAVKVDGNIHSALRAKLRVSGYPTTIFLTADEKELGRVRGAVPYREMMDAMNDALKKFEGGE